MSKTQDWQVYLVGGAVRDELLQKPVADRDWVVVGATPEDMLKAGYQQVGKDFPVFLHPQSKEEYALARTERKQGQGYTGFQVDSSSSVTLTEDLLRRDLTVNAMARAEDGRLIDPYGGYQDLQARLLRHVSPAFVEDPLRVLRVARFAARYAEDGFRVADETLALMRELADSGELLHLSPERVWRETENALRSSQPEVYFEVLRRCGALAVLMPELDRLWGVPNPPQWHPEIDTGVHTMMVLQQAARLSDDTRVRLAALLHDVGKGLTPAAEWPSHRGHEKAGVAVIDNMAARLAMPNDYKQLAKLVSEWHLHCHKALELRPATIIKLLNAVDVWRKPERFEQFLLACQADHLGRLGYTDKPYPQADFLRRCQVATAAVNVADIVASGLTGAAIGQALHKARLQAIAKLPR